MRRKGFWIAASCILAMLGLRPIFSSGAAPTSTERIIHEFTGGNDGGYPVSDLTLDAEGNLYGTTAGGGIYGWGTVFELKRTTDGWKEEVLYNFAGKSSDGGDPEAGVIFDNAGNLYGVTDGQFEGNLTANVFKLTPNSGGWTESVLYSFNVAPFGPQNDLVLDAQGNLFGTLSAGGIATGCSVYGCGTVFELMPQSNGSWKETTIYEFPGAPDGAIPSSGVVLDSQRNVWGMTEAGGRGKCEYVPKVAGCGIVYELTPNSDGSWKEAVIYDFARGGGFAVNPSSGLILDGASHLLATTIAGGDGPGTVLELTQSQKGWQQDVLYRFYGDPDGDTPVGRLGINSDGALFGVTFRGGKNAGTVFELQRSQTNGWKERVLHSFVGGIDGASPQAGLVFDSQGHLYGTTGSGGGGTVCTGGCGTVYEITP
jgi:uncharacterized repeat protein (TIGR03803 family)